MKGIERHQIISPGQIRGSEIVFGHNGNKLQAIQFADELVELINRIAAEMRKMTIRFYFIYYNITIMIF